MVLKSDPRCWQEKCICNRKSFFEPVAHLRPAEAHLALEVQRTRQSSCPPPAHQPRAANADHQNHPDTRRVNDLHQKSKRADHGKNLGVQMDRGLHTLIICLNCPLPEVQDLHPVGTLDWQVPTSLEYRTRQPGMSLTPPQMTRMGPAHLPDVLKSRIRYTEINTVPSHEH